MSGTSSPRFNVAKIAMWLAIGMLVAAALLGGFFIIVGDQSNVAGRAWMTLFLVAAFAGAVLIDTAATRGRDPIYLGGSTIVNVVLVGVGLFKIWNGWGQPADTASGFVWTEQFFRFLAVVILLRAAIGLTQIYVPFALRRSKSPIMKGASFGAVIFGWLTALVLALPAAFPEPVWPEWWWRASAATALVAVVLMVIPPIVRAFEGRDDEPETAAPGVPQGYAQAGYGQVPGAIPPAGYAQQPGQPQSGYPQQPQVPAGYAQPGYPAQGYAQPGYAQPGYAQPQQGHPQQGHAQPGQQPGYPYPGYAQPGQPQPVAHPQAPVYAQPSAPQAPGVPAVPQRPAAPPVAPPVPAPQAAEPEQSPGEQPPTPPQ